jgi:hypothetical protein
MGLAKDEQTQRSLHASFDLIGKTPLNIQVGDKKLSEEYLRRKKADILKRFVTHLSGYGSVILRANKEKFQAAIKELETDILAFQNGVKAEVETSIANNRDALVTALLPGVKESPPDHYTKVHGPNPQESILKELLTKEIADIFGQADDVINAMKLAVVFKDVAYELLIHPKFVETARKAMPGVDFLHEEFDAARGKKPDSPSAK